MSARRAESQDEQPAGISEAPLPAVPEENASAYRDELDDLLAEDIDDIGISDLDEVDARGGLTQALGVHARGSVVTSAVQSTGERAPMRDAPLTASGARSGNTVSIDAGQASGVLATEILNAPTISVRVDLPGAASSVATFRQIDDNEVGPRGLWWS